MSSIISFIKSMGPIILQIMILYAMGIESGWKRILPFYGQYYYYSSLLPEKKDISYWMMIVNIIFAGIFVVIIALGRDSLIALTENYNNIGTSTAITAGLSVFLLIFSILGAIVANFIFRIVLELKLAPKFGYNEGIGILAAFLPLVGGIIYYINIKDKSIGPSNTRPSSEQNDEYSYSKDDCDW